MPGTVRNLVFLADTLPPGATWTVAGIGPAEIPLATAAIAMGGHVRVGIEDNLHLPDGALATNAQLVQTAATIARTMGRQIATPAEARQILSLDPENKDRIRTQID
jgi:3-keto-5-aminohexanoate cleavage enzyme